ncbi:hypothetical protein [Croceibacterium ferulae]|uniref:hypothetical protein n=1 Tax=Croceibacterium ferulae TaxID=1854641 RepID=UPI000EAD7CF6|nr:hypothetical protein [Croceibacterium ferulae]
MPFDITTAAQALLANTAVVGIAAWIGKGWVERRLQMLKAAHAEQLEGVKGEQARALESVKSDLSNMGRSFQASVDKKMMVFKTHFEIEFQAYRDIWTLCDQSHDYAAQALALFDRKPIDDEAAEEERTASVRRYDDCRLALEAGRRHRPFVDKAIADNVIKLLRIAVEVTESYKDVYRISIIERAHQDFDRSYHIDEARGKLRDMRTLSDTIADQISARIARMYVADFGTE